MRAMGGKGRCEMQRAVWGLYRCSRPCALCEPLQVRVCCVWPQECWRCVGGGVRVVQVCMGRGLCVHVVCETDYVGEGVQGEVVQFGLTFQEGRRLPPWG